MIHSLLLLWSKMALRMSPPSTTTRHCRCLVRGISLHSLPPTNQSCLVFIIIIHIQREWKQTCYLLAKIWFSGGFKPLHQQLESSIHWQHFMTVRWSFLKIMSCDKWVTLCAMMAKALINGCPRKSILFWGQFRHLSMAHSLLMSLA